MGDAKAELAAILLYAIEDCVAGVPTNWPKVKQGLDDLYDGNILTEKIADHLVGKFKDEYAAAVAKGHEKMKQLEAKGDA